MLLLIIIRRHRRLEMDEQLNKVDRVQSMKEDEKEKPKESVQPRFVRTKRKRDWFSLLPMMWRSSFDCYRSISFEDELNQLKNRFLHHRHSFFFVVPVRWLAWAFGASGFKSTWNWSPSWILYLNGKSSIRSRRSDAYVCKMRWGYLSSSGPQTPILNATSST